MATPEDLADLAIGFSLTDGLVRRRSEIQDLEICRHAEGIELRMWLAAEQRCRRGDAGSSARPVVGSAGSRI